MRMPVVFYRCLVGALFLFAILLSDSGRAQDLSRQGGKVNYGENQFPDSYDPITSIQNLANIRMSELMFDALLDVDPFGSFVPEIAADLPVVQGNTVIFNLKNNVTWHDGTLLTSEDVKFTVDLINHPLTVCSPYLKKVVGHFQSCQVLGPYQVKFVLKTPEENPLPYFTFKIIPRHVVGRDYLQKQDEFVRRPVGSGLFAFDEHIKNIIKMKVQDPHHRGRAYLDEMRMVYIPDPQIMLDLIKSPDGLDAIVDVRLKDISELQGTGEYNLRRYNSLNFYYIGYNFQHPALRLKKVRQAITLGIDRARILQTHYYGKGHLISGPYPPASHFNNPEIRPDLQTFRPELSLRLLDEAGCLDTDGDNIREYQGQPLSFELIIQTDGAKTTLQERAALAIQDYLRDIGIQIKIVHADEQKVNNQVFRGKEFDMIMAGWSFDIANDISSLFRSGAYNNFIGFSHPQVDKLLDAISREKNPLEIKSLHFQLHRLLFDELPYTFLWTLDKYAVIKKKVEGTENIDPFDFFKFVDGWYIPIDYR